MSRITSFLLRSTVTLSACLALSIASAGCGGGTAPTGGAGTPDSSGGSSGGLVGQPAPEITATDVTGEGPATLKDAAGRVVILDFWATFCEPCKKSFPKYQELMDQFGGDLVVIAVSVDDPEDVKEDQIKEFVSATGVKFKVVWDKDKNAVKTYSPPKMPTSYIIDKSGVVKHIHAGYESGEEAKIGDEVRALLGK
ncbi:MAG: TlpA family protein disulfide reductase [Polyangiaceae bacterium]|nr:TlpA family protein disulfide reductase [Polyangiaceae bacterium]NUQ78713.1 TlpA family protein disulfide reductase [Polyangiaceae bacterium]